MEKVRRNIVKKKQEDLVYKVFRSPIGDITLIASDRALKYLNMGRSKNEFLGTRGTNRILEITEQQLKEYFKGQRKTFDIPLDPDGTDFQKRVWKQLLKIPYGQTITYGEQAKRIDKPKASRAVGAANGKNPIGIIVPCHRVIGASGHLTGFAAGLNIKRQLLDIEARSTHSR